MREIGTLFAREGEVDKWFTPKIQKIEPEELAMESAYIDDGGALRFSPLPPNVITRVTAEKQWKPLPSTEQLWRIQARIVAHVLDAPEREFAALRRANARDFLLTHAQERDFVIERMTKL